VPGGGFNIHLGGNSASEKGLGADVLNGEAEIELSQGEASKFRRKTGAWLRKYVAVCRSGTLCQAEKWGRKRGEEVHGWFSVRGWEKKIDRWGRWLSADWSLRSGVPRAIRDRREGRQMGGESKGC